MDPSDDTPRPRRARRVVKLVLGLLVALLACELGLRFLLFHNSDVARSMGGSLRRPTLFAARWSDAHWKLQHLFLDPDKRRPADYEPTLGWIAPRIAPPSYRHADEATVGARRPVLLYGDSFAACVTSPADCWEGLFERSPLGSDLALLNYGVPAYGFDQTCLLFEKSIARHARKKPLVVISLLVNVNLDRSSLAIRGWPKPHFTVGTDNELISSGPVIDGADDFIAQNPVGIASYLGRLVLHGASFPPGQLGNWLRGDERLAEETRRLNRALLERLREVIDQHSLDAFVLVFHGRPYFEGDHQLDDWREPFLLSELDRLGLRYVLSRHSLASAIESSGRPLDDYFFTRGGAKRHYTPLGNRAAFQALERGLAGDFDG